MTLHITFTLFSNKRLPSATSAGQIAEGAAGIRFADCRTDNLDG